MTFEALDASVVDSIAIEHEWLAISIDLEARLKLSLRKRFTKRRASESEDFPPEESRIAFEVDPRNGLRSRTAHEERLLGKPFQGAPGSDTDDLLELRHLFP